MPAWWLEENRPRSCTGTDLIGKQLVLDAERPPEKTNFSGMEAVYVKEVKDNVEAKHWNIYKVLMTEKNITTAIDCMVNKKAFSFYLSKGEKYPEVELWRP